MKILFTLALVIIAGTADAQKDTAVLNADSSKTFTSVQVEAKFPGGANGWTRYLEANLNVDLGSRYIKPKKGQTIEQVALISFLVDTLGNIREVQIANPNEIHPKLAAESMRVIREGPKWAPAEINGKKVIYRQKQRITWQVTGG